MDFNFKNGKCTIKSNRKIIATVIYRPDFFNGLKVSYNEKYPYSIAINGMQAEAESLQEIESLLISEIG